MKNLKNIDYERTWELGKSEKKERKFQKQLRMKKNSNYIKENRVLTKKKRR